MRWAHQRYPPRRRRTPRSTAWISATPRRRRWRWRPRRHPHRRPRRPPSPHPRGEIVFAPSEVRIEEERGAPVRAERGARGGVLPRRRVGARVGGAGGRRARVPHAPRGGDIPLASRGLIHVAREVALVSAIGGVWRGGRSGDAPPDGPEVLGLHRGGGAGVDVDVDERRYQVGGGSR
jgi:hypothetical protein